LIGFVVTWHVVWFVLTLGIVRHKPTAFTVLIVSSTAIALLVAARARRNRNSA
jgi:hypothetical protein